MDPHIFHTNAYWTCFCIKWIQSFREEVLSAVAKGGGEGRRVNHALWEGNGYHFGLNCPGSKGRAIGGWLKTEGLTFKKF